MAAHTQPMVLLVEDEPAQREVLAYNLEAEGFADCLGEVLQDGDDLGDAVLELDAVRAERGEQVQALGGAGDSCGHTGS